MAAQRPKAQDRATIQKTTQGRGKGSGAEAAQRKGTTGGGERERKKKEREREKEKGERPSFVPRGEQQHPAFLSFAPAPSPRPSLHSPAHSARASTAAGRGRLPPARYSQAKARPPRALFTSCLPYPRGRARRGPPAGGSWKCQAPSRWDLAAHAESGSGRGRERGRWQALQQRQLLKRETSSHPSYLIPSARRAHANDSLLKRRLLYCIQCQKRGPCTWRMQR